MHSQSKNKSTFNSGGKIMLNQKASRPLLILTQVMLCLILMITVAITDLTTPSKVQASIQANTFTNLPMVSKYHFNLLDDSFSEDGKATTSAGTGESGGHVALQSDGKIILAGISPYNNYTYEFILLRFNQNGSFDTTFGEAGLVVIDLDGENYLTAIAIQPDDKIIAVGYSIESGDLYSNIMVVRLNPDGSLDATFDGDGILISDVGINDVLFSVVIQPDGKIVAGGVDADYDNNNEDMLLVRLNPDGSLDTSLGGDGIVTTSYGNYESIWALEVDSAGNIVAAGDVAEDLSVLRYLSDGTLDTSFDGDGLATLDVGGYYNHAMDVLIQPDGKIIAAGLTDTWIQTDILLARFSTDGSLDPTFDSDGVVATDLSDYDVAYSIALQSDGRLVVGGNYYNDWVLLRYLPNGSLDSSFGKQGVFAIDFDGQQDSGRSIAIQSDGKIVMGGIAHIMDNDYFALIRTK
jgi:uncharacterized delta-60 repeat protein